MVRIHRGDNNTCKTAVAIQKSARNCTDHLLLARQLRGLLKQVVLLAMDVNRKMLPIAHIDKDRWEGCAFDHG